MKLLSTILFFWVGFIAFGQNRSNSLFHKNTFVFDETMNMNNIQHIIDSLHSGLIYPEGEFSEQRYAFMFKPGTYHLDVKVGYYTQVIGLGNSPSDVTIVGAVRSNSRDGSHVLCNFWRSVENLTIVPTSADRTNTWAVSQASPLRKVHIKGNLSLFEGASSGGFMADCKIDGTVISGSQQQWFCRNSDIGKWDGGVWNMVFLGVKNAPQENWPEKPVTTILETPIIREKPYWTYSDDEYYLNVPTLKKQIFGITEDQVEKRISIQDFFIASPDMQSEEINKALNVGKNIVFTPGIYHLAQSLHVKHPNTVLMGLGMATLMPTNGNSAIDVKDEDGIIVSGLMIDAALPASKTLMKIGNRHTQKSHAKNPICLYDVFFRVGGPHIGSAKQCLIINSNDVIVDHIWLWRADHGNGVGWDKNTCANGLIVNGDNVTAYGLFDEHFQEYQLVWNGENGQVFMYQSEMPYDPPTAESWKHQNTNGYASYKVGNHVKHHKAWGVGIYNVFKDAPIVVDQAIETPSGVENGFYHKVIFCLGGNEKSIVKSIINGKGGSVEKNNRKQTMP